MTKKTPGGMDYELAQQYRQAIFLMIQTKEDWKEPIGHLLPKRLGTNSNFQAAVTDAVIHFTGSVPKFEEKPHGVWVTAAGYYKTIGA